MAGGSAGVAQLERRGRAGGEAHLNMDSVLGLHKTRTDQQKANAWTEDSDLVRHSGKGAQKLEPRQKYQSSFQSINTNASRDAQLKSSTYTVQNTSRRTSPSHVDPPTMQRSSNTDLQHDFNSLCA